MRLPPSSTLFPYTTLFRSSSPKTSSKSKRLIDSSPHHCMAPRAQRSEEHTSELQSRGHLVCRLLLEKKNNAIYLGLSQMSGAHNANRALLILSDGVDNHSI